MSYYESAQMGSQGTARQWGTPGEEESLDRSESPGVPEGATSIEAYEVFAQFYDRILSHVPYSTWADYLLTRPWSAETSLLHMEVVDLACGTGLLTGLIKKRVGRITGMDISSGMLSVARERYPDINFVPGKLQGPLPFADNSVDWAYTAHDSLNYLTEEKDLFDHFREVRRVLKSGGVYSTDTVSMSNLQINFNKKKPTRGIGQWSMDWVNHFHEADGRMTSVLTFHGPRGELYTEVHRQQYYPPDRIREIAVQHGFQLVAQDYDYSPFGVEEPTSMNNFHFVKR